MYGRSGGSASVHMIDLKVEKEKVKDEKRHNSIGGRELLSPNILDYTSNIRAAVGSDIFQITVGTNAAYNSTEANFSVSTPLLPRKYYPSCKVL